MKRSSSLDTLNFGFYETPYKLNSGFTFSANDLPFASKNETTKMLLQIKEHLKYLQFSVASDALHALASRKSCRVKSN